MSNKISMYALIISYVVMIYAGFIFYPKWNQSRTEATLSWDASGYYMYLPATFIYKDLKGAKYKDAILEKYNMTPDFQQAYVDSVSGNYVMKYAIGQSITMLPGFFIGHYWASHSDIYPADGFSFPYQVSVGVSLFLVGLLGLWYFRKVLLEYFSDKVTAASLLILVVGTNYLDQAAITQAMTHSNLFTFFTLVIWNTIQFYKKQTWKYIFVLGLLCGWAALIRPIDIIIVLIPLLWGINTFAELKSRLIFLWQSWQKILVFSIIVLAIGAIQLFYWKYATGNWLVYSYQDQGFSWFRPHVKSYCMSYRCGWLRYTPMMFIAFVGIVPLMVQKVNRFAVVSVFLLSFYLVTAWDVWDYGGTSGRAMVQYYPILMFCIAAFLTAVGKRKVMIPPVAAVIGLFLYLNIWWTINAHGGKVRVLELSREYYWTKVGRWSEDEDDVRLLDIKHVFRHTPKQETIVYSNDFSKDTSANALMWQDKPAIQLNEELHFTPLYAFDNPHNGQKWMRASALFSIVKREHEVWRQAQFILRFHKGDAEIAAHVLRIHRFINDGQSRTIHLDAIVPKEWDYATISFWNTDSPQAVYIQDLKVVTFDE